ncbi:MAG: TonB-dependent receptor [Chloroflexi bacterium]|nr:TonB-dependent receptor [Chloroflexota bacterium]
MFRPSLTAEWEASPDLTVKGIASRRSSRYHGGLDDDSTVLDFMSFPEVGEAGQTSLELQVSGERDALDFVAGLWAFREDGFNLQPDAVFAGGPTTFHVLQDTESEAVYASIGYRPVPALRISAGLRHTEDFKDARAVLNDFVDARSRCDWREWNWDLAATWQLRDRASVFANIANGYQAGQFPPRPYCLFGFVDVSRPGNVSAPNCFAAGDHITAVNHEIGFKGSLGERLEVSASLFLTNYDNLPLSASDTSGAGFDTRNVIVGQRSAGIEWEGRFELHSRLSVDTRIGYLDSNPEAEGIVPLLSPRWTISVSPEWILPLAEGNLALRADYSWRDSMYGEPAANRRPWSELPARELLNFDISYRPADSNWLFALYGRNVFDERYAHATLNTGDYILRILSNDASEFGLRAALEW